MFVEWLPVAILAICLVAGLWATSSGNHDVAYFPYFGMMITSLGIFFTYTTDLQILVQVSLWVVALFGLFMAIDSLMGGKQKS